MMHALLLKEARHSSGMTQRDLSEAARTSTTTISAYENGHKVPRSDVLLRLLSATNHEVELKRKQSRSDRILDRLSWLLASHIATDPSQMDRLHGLLGDRRYRSDYAEVWASLVNAGVWGVVAVLTSAHPDMQPLKSDCPLWLDSPIPDEERLAVIGAIHGT